MIPGPDFVQLSLVPMLISVFAAMACALPGNFLVLRRQALLGDAISHAVLPGIVLGFLVTGTITTVAMLAGATGAAVVAAVLIEFIRRIGRIETGAAMGIVFTALFAGGVILLELSDARSVHLDVEHALYGNLESLVWLDATGWGSLLDREALGRLPPELARMLVIFVLGALTLWVFWRPIVIATFDETFAMTLGLPVRAIGFGLTLMAALAAIGAFAAVGSIMAIAMFIGPAATARLLTNRLDMQIWISLLVAAGVAIVGYVLAGYGLLWVGLSGSISAAGMMATLSGLVLGAAALWGPCRRRASS